VRLRSRCHLQIAALRSFGDIRSASGMASRASRIPRSTGVRPIASTPRAPREARRNLGCSRLVGGQPIRVRLLSGYLPSIGKRPFDRDDLFPRSRAAYGPLDVLRPKAEGGGFSARWDAHRCWSALSRSSTSPSISPAVTRIPFCACGQSQKRRRNVVAVSLGFLCGTGRRHPIAVGIRYSCTMSE